MNAEPRVEDQSLDSNTETPTNNPAMTVDGGSGATEVRTPESTSPSNKFMSQRFKAGGRKPQDSIHAHRASIERKSSLKNSGRNRASTEESKTSKKRNLAGGLENGVDVDEM